MSEKQSIPWARLGTEVLAIVGSILLAFWIDAWWDGRKDLVEEREILIGLEAEFTDLNSRLDHWASTNEQAHKLLGQYLKEDVTALDSEAHEWVHAYAMLVNVLDQGGALDALLASGRLERIEDRTIRTRLAKWPDWLEDIHTNDISVRQFAWGEIIPYMNGYGIPQTVCDQGKVVCSRPGDIPPAYMRIAKDETFRSMLIVRRTMMAFSIEDHRNASKEASDILELIRDRIGTLDQHL